VIGGSWVKVPSARTNKNKNKILSTTNGQISLQIQTLMQMTTKTVKTSALRKRLHLQKAVPM
jgi:hypothetical protein